MEGKHKNRAPAIAGVLLSSAARSKSVRRMSVFGSAHISRPAPKRARISARVSGIGGSIAKPTARTRSPPIPACAVCLRQTALGAGLRWYLKIAYTQQVLHIDPSSVPRLSSPHGRHGVSPPSVRIGAKAKQSEAKQSEAKRVKEKPVHGANTKIKGRRHGAISLKFHINRICAFWRLQISSSASRWAFRSVLFCEALLRLRSERTGA